MENFSKNKEPDQEQPQPPKRGRGRPPIFKTKEPLEPIIYTKLYGRTLQNRIYGAIAIQALTAQPEDLETYAWLLEKRPGGQFKKGTLLNELGRLKNAQFIRDAAIPLCRDKPRVTFAVKRLQGYREKVRQNKKAK